MATSYKIVIAFVLFISGIILFNSCSKNGGNNQPPPDPCTGVTISVAGTINHPSSPGASNGSITVSATGGSGYMYSLNGGAFQSSNVFSNLQAGAYTVVARSSNGCSGSSVFTLADQNPCAGITITVAATLTHPSAPGATNGSIVATASGSSGYMYSLNGGAFQSSGTFSNLGAGSYTVTARDANNCTGSNTFILTAQNPCSGVTITVSGTVTHPTAPGASNGSIMATASGSTGFMYSLNGGTFQSSGTFSNLGAGTYTVTARDLNNCTGSNTFTLVAQDPCSGVTITVNSTTTGNRLCEAPNGSISINATGGTGPYQYRLNAGAFQSSNVFSNLSAGTYNITVRDANNCTGTSSATVTNLPSGPLFLAVKNVLQNNCVSCHNPSQPNGGMDWTVDCNIVMFKDRIHARAVQGTPSPMPPSGLMPASERQKIVDWINAGGRITD